jgi:hypothetical protein
VFTISLKLYKFKQSSPLLHIDLRKFQMQVKKGARKIVTESSNESISTQVTPLRKEARTVSSSSLEQPSESSTETPPSKSKREYAASVWHKYFTGVQAE